MILHLETQALPYWVSRPDGKRILRQPLRAAVRDRPAARRLACGHRGTRSTCGAVSGRPAAAVCDRPAAAVGDRRRARGRKFSPPSEGGCRSPISRNAPTLSSYFRVLTFYTRARNMNRKLGLAGLASAISFPLFGGAAWGGAGVQVNIKNDGIDDILVTVYDTTIGPDAVILPRARISGFTTVPLSVAPDATGHANVSWTAVTADPNGRKCGHADHTGLVDSEIGRAHV